MKPGFYKYVAEEEESLLLYAPNKVFHKDFTLDSCCHTDYTYPVDGWYWFDTEEEAKQYFGIPLEVPDVPNE